MTTHALRRLARRVRESDHVVVHTGPGLLAETALPTTELRERVWGDPDGAFTVDRFEREPEALWADWLDFWSDVPAPGSVPPQPVHDRVAELVGEGHVETVVTETAFGLLDAAGVPAENTVEFHGRVDRARCRRCGATEPADPAETVGHRQCRSCLATLGPDIVLAEEPPQKHDRLRAWTDAERADLYLAVGTDLTVYPTAENAEHAVETGADLVAVGRQPTALDGAADERIEMDAPAALARLRDAVAILH